jgi:hypothetical protein
MPSSRKLARSAGLNAVRSSGPASARRGHVQPPGTPAHVPDLRRHPEVPPPGQPLYQPELDIPAAGAV